MNPWHDTARRLGNRWQRQRSLRAAVTLAIIMLALVTEYLLMTSIRLVQPVDVGKDSKYAQVVAEPKHQEIVISNLSVYPPDGELFSHEGRTNETVTFSTSTAKLSSESLDVLKGLAEDTGKPPPPEGFERIEYLIADNVPRKQSLQSREGITRPDTTTGKPYETCSVSISVRLVDGKVPKEIHFYQPQKGTANYQSIVVTPLGADLICEFLVSEPKGGPYSPGCGKSIQVAKWNMPLQGNLAQMEVILAANSITQLNFHTIDAAQAGQLTNSGGQFDPLTLGDQSLQAESIKVIRASQTDSPAPLPAREVRATDSKTPLTVRSIRSGENELKLELAGEKALVKSNGEDVESISLLARMLQSGLISAFVGAGHLAILGWAYRSVLKSAPAQIRGPHR